MRLIGRAGSLAEGAYRVLAWVVSVMLAADGDIFPLFTPLEDVGYLPRVAYNLDRPFKRRHACGKQALTMCMGLGSQRGGRGRSPHHRLPRERSLAMLTNAFMPCNGRFPALIALITMFFRRRRSLRSGAAPLTGVIAGAVLLTFAATGLLSALPPRGLESGFVLEPPPYRMPQVGQVLVRSIFDRTLFVLGRAAAVAAPAGAAIWALANISVGGASLLRHAADALDPVGRALGMDGAILLAFILGLPANEIVFAGGGDDLYGAGRACAAGWARFGARGAGRERLDAGDGGVRDDFFALALAVLHDAPDDKEGERRHALGSPRCSLAHRFRRRALRAGESAVPGKLKVVGPHLLAPLLGSEAASR